MSDQYDSDIVTWSERQANLLRRVAAGEQVNDQVDWSNIIDEVETVGRAERAALRSHIAVVLEHLIKLQASPATEPRNGWKTSILSARREIQRTLKDSPVLRGEVAGMILAELPAEQQDVASSLAIYGETPRVAIGSLDFTENQVLGDWFPAEVPGGEQDASPPQSDREGQ